MTSGGTARALRRITTTALTVGGTAALVVLAWEGGSWLGLALVLLLAAALGLLTPRDPRPDPSGALQPAGVTEPDEGAGQEPAEWDALRRRAEHLVEPGHIVWTGVPEHVRQADHVRMRVVIAQGPDSGGVATGVRPGSADGVRADIPTGPVMGVQCLGDGFRITPLSTHEQLLRDDATWEYDLLAERSGRHRLTLMVSLRLPVVGVPDVRYSLPVLERQVRVKLNPVKLVTSLLHRYWQPLAGSALGLAVTAWRALFD